MLLRILIIPAYDEVFVGRGVVFPYSHLPLFGVCRICLHSNNVHDNIYFRRIAYIICMKYKKTDRMLDGVHSPLHVYCFSSSYVAQGGAYLQFSLFFKTKDTPWYYKIISNTKVDGCFGEKKNPTKTKLMLTINSSIHSWGERDLKTFSIHGYLQPPCRWEMAEIILWTSESLYTCSYHSIPQYNISAWQLSEQFLCFQRSTTFNIHADQNSCYIWAFSSNPFSHNICMYSRTLTKILPPSTSFEKWHNIEMFFWHSLLFS